MNRKKSIVVCAYHNVGYRCLEELLRQDADIALVFTHDDSPSEEIWFASVGFALFLMIRRFIIGAEVEGVFTLFAILFFFIGIVIFGIGLVGEYVGRIYQEVRKRPRYVVRRVHGYGLPSLHHPEVIL